MWCGCAMLCGQGISRALWGTGMAVGGGEEKEGTAVDDVGNIIDSDGGLGDVGRAHDLGHALTRHPAQRTQQPQA